MAIFILKCICDPIFFFLGGGPYEVELLEGGQLLERVSNEQAVQAEKRDALQGGAIHSRKKKRKRKKGVHGERMLALSTVYGLV